MASSSNYKKRTYSPYFLSTVRSTTFRRMTEPLSKNKFYNHVCQVIMFSLQFDKHTKLQELRNTVDDALRLQSKSQLDDDTWKACMKILNDKGLIAIWS
ncbi:MAG TPA: hypothetical protein VEH06_13510 [Candidatus Bathyarchaeia archaeon]|nr:hypothetical protein [Candidatus Bathyarchaeia archaeon]